MKTCPRCGNFSEAEDAFCGQCGLQLSIGNVNMDFTQKALNIDDIRYNLGIVYYKKKNYQAALEVLEKILKADPNNSRALEMMKMVRAEMKSPPS